MMVVGGEGMLEGQTTLLNGMLHCWTNGMCDLPKAAFSPPPAASESSTLQQQLKDGVKKINSGTEVKS